MDRIIATLSAESDGDLNLCLDDGIAYQHDHDQVVDYDAAYFEKYQAYRGSEISERLNEGRIAFVNKYVQHSPVLDVGIGNGDFVSRRLLTWGRDVNPAAVRWLQERRLWADELHSFSGYTFWDVIEHVPDPGEYLRHIKVGAYLFASIPVFTDLRRVRDSKHYRPGEHLYYWTRAGFIAWMSWHGFRIVERSDFETHAGRDAIESFAFRRSEA